VALPTGAQLAAWMVGQRLLATIPEDLSVLDGAMAAAILAFEGATFWSPFLAGAAVTRRFDGPGGYDLYPGVGILSVNSLKVGGTLLTEDVDFFLQDRKLGRYAYQRIEFAGYVVGDRRVVEIAGVFGAAQEIPDDVLLALLSKAAAGVSTDSTSTGALKREKAGPVEYEYDVSGGATTKAAQLLATYDGAVAAWRRMV